MKKIRPLKFASRKARNGEWYAVILAPNGRMLFKSSETYKRKRSSDRAIAMVVSHAAVHG